MSQRTFRIISSDYGIVAGLQQLARHCAYNAPGVTLVVEPMTPDVVRDPENALRRVDGLMLPHGVIHDFPHVDVTADRWVCVMSMDNRQVGDRLDVKDLSHLPWVAVFTTSFGDTPLANQMRAQAVTPRDQVIVNSFSAVPAMVAGTDRIAFMQERLVVPLVGAWNLRVVDPPFAVPALVESLWWHPRCDNDPGHRWLRDTIAAVNAIG
ncbi:MAG: LysR substrate-binding domain-containing protein [Mycobacterium sp.]